MYLKKMMKDETVISYTIVIAVVFGIPLGVACALMAYTIIQLIFYLPFNWPIFILAVLFCVGSIYLLFKEVLIWEFSVIMNRLGFTIKERNRITSKEKIQSFIWEDIKTMSFSGFYTGRPEMLVFYKEGSSKWYWYGAASYKHDTFVRLARYYSGRDGIIKPSYFERKRKGLYQKDW